MKIKMLSIATVTALAFAISSSFAASSKDADMQEANSFLKNLSSENSAEPAPTADADSLEALEKDLNNLESSITDSTNSNVIVGKVKNTGKIEIESIDSSEDTPKQVVDSNDQAAQDLVFLRNIPEGTRLTVTKDFIILPQNQNVIFYKGERVIQSPIYQNPATTFCYIELKTSGKARVIKEDKKFVVTKNETKSFIKTLDTGENLKIYYSKIFVDNKNVNFISCYSGEKGTSTIPQKPLTVKDLRIQSGGAFKLEFPAYEEI